MLNNCYTFASCIINAMNCVCGRVSDRKRGEGSERKDCSSAPLPAQQELFLEPQKQRSRIAFHPPCNYVVSPPNVVLEDSLLFFVAMFRPNLK